MRNEEDGRREVRVLGSRWIQPRRPGPERDDARPVGGDRGVVARHPETTARVALSARKLRQKDAAACVEFCLQHIRVVARGRARRPAQAEQHDRDCRRKYPTTPHRTCHGSGAKPSYWLWCTTSTLLPSGSSTNAP